MASLKELRVNKKLTQEQLAVISGVSVRNIRAYEQGTCNINNAEAGNVYRLAKALNCKMIDIMNISDIN